MAVGQARELFDVRTARTFGMDWSVTADGQRFLVNLPADEIAAPSLSLLVNWPALISR